MQNRFTTRFPVFIRRPTIGLVVFATTCIATPILSGAGFSNSQAPINASQRNLTFEERVAYQRIIEDVYWRHRLWPKDNPGPKPSLDAVISQEQLENRVTGYLRRSKALEDYWQQPLTGNQLQAEMDRMARNTRQPEMLQELFEALGNEPLVIAECLARPVLVDRSLSPREHEQLRTVQQHL